MVAFAMVFLLGAFGMNFPIFASTMALEFGQEADGYGLLSSILAIGSLAGALLAARRDRARIRMVIFGAGLFAVAGAVSAFMPTYWLYAVTLMFTGFAIVTTLTTANGYVQTTTDPALRGRVLALYMAILMGGTPIGAPIVGWVAAEFGPRTAIMLGAVAAFVAFAIGFGWLLLSGRLHRHESRRFALSLDETRPIGVVAPEEFSDHPHPAALRPRRRPRDGARPPAPAPHGLRSPTAVSSRSLRPETPRSLSERSETKRSTGSGRIATVDDRRGRRGRGRLES
jgi:MFS family permease